LLFRSFVSATTTFFFSNKIFFELQELVLFFYSFFHSLFFQQQHKDLVHKTLEQMDAQIYGIFRLAPSTNMGQSLGGSGDDQL
jgi:predicted MPP superfamily phosphohydrolase